MSKTVLILGASGRFGRNASAQFSKAGWQVTHFDRARDSLLGTAQGIDVIVNSWNPAYPDWAIQVPKLHAEVIDVARETGATVIVPGNVYVFGQATSAPWSERSDHAATNPLGRIRIEMENAYRESGVRAILLRSGDFLDTGATGNWFDMILTKRLEKGVFTYPGDPDIPHAWAFLPDLCRAAVELAEERAQLPVFADISYAGLTMTGREMHQHLQEITGWDLRLKRMNWLPIRLASPFWPLGRSLLEMRYLWDTPHWLDGARFQSFVPSFVQNGTRQALQSSVLYKLSEAQIHPDQPVTAGL